MFEPILEKDEFRKAVEDWCHQSGGKDLGVFMWNRAVTWMNNKVSLATQPSNQGVEIRGVELGVLETLRLGLEALQSTDMNLRVKAAWALQAAISREEALKAGEQVSGSATKDTEVLAPGQQEPIGYVNKFRSSKFVEYIPARDWGSIHPSDKSNYFPVCAYHQSALVQLTENDLNLLKVFQETIARLRPYNEKLCELIAKAEYEAEQAQERKGEVQ